MTDAARVEWWNEVHDAAAAIWGYANDAFQVGDEEVVKALAEKILAIAEEQGASPSWRRSDAC